jgi:hypothetical protein
VDESQSPRADSSEPNVDKTSSKSVVKIGVGFFLALILLVALNWN